MKKLFHIKKFTQYITLLINRVLCKYINTCLWYYLFTVNLTVYTLQQNCTPPPAGSVPVPPVEHFTAHLCFPFPAAGMPDSTLSPLRCPCPCSCRGRARGLIRTAPTLRDRCAPGGPDSGSICVCIPSPSVSSYSGLLVV